MSESPKGLHLVLLTIWSYLRNVWYLFIIFIIGYVLFNSLDQAQDFVIAIVDGPELGYYVSVIILLFFWSYITWYSCSIVLEINPDNYQYIDDKLSRLFCRIMGFIPSLIMAITFFNAEANHRSRSVLIAVVCLVTGLLFTLFFKWRGRMNNVEGKWPSLEDVYEHNTDKYGVEKTPSLREEITFIGRYPNVRYYFLYFSILFLIILLLFCFPATIINLSRKLRPASVVMLALSFFTFTFTVVFYFHDLQARPFIFFIIAWMIGISFINDNTKIPVIKYFKDNKDFRLEPGAAFDKWYKYKKDKWIAAGHTEQDTMPVIFIATQGGGIRGEIWTTEVLDQLKRTFPGFYEQVFCIGGASGGTVGAVYYNAYVYDSLNKKPGDDKIKFENFQRFTGADCLSPVTASFAFGENLQHFLPFKVPQLERSKVMMDAFNTSYELHMNSKLTQSSFLSLYYPDDDTANFNCELPSLFINGTLAETGQRIITSNLRLTDSANFRFDIDFFEKTRAHISIATASLNCMRFPLLLSGGLFYYGDEGKQGNSIGHMVDGGYRENTGLQAMYSLMSLLKDSLKGKKVKPVLLYLRNGGIEYNMLRKDSSSAIRLLHDIATPFSGLVNVNGTSLPSLGIMTMIEQQVTNENPLNMYYNQIWLRDTLYRNNDKFPLGLYISDTASHRLRVRASQINKFNPGLIEVLSHYFKNPGD